MNTYPGGVWPVMLTPFDDQNRVDERALRALVDWYIDHGVKGLFAACQSSEIMYLSLEERVQIVKITLDQAAGRVPVVASGHISDDFDAQIKELNAVAEAGPAALILITNHMARQDEDDSVWRKGMERLLNALDPALSLGMYECPVPYKRLISTQNLKWCAETGRFYFIKDTCCDIDTITARLQAVQGTCLKLYNANVTTLLASLRAGAAGFSGVMANFHPDLYAWLTENIHHPLADEVQAALTLGSLIERQLYPVNAKYHLSCIEGLPMTTHARTQDDRLLTATFKEEVRQMNIFMQSIKERIHTF